MVIEAIILLNVGVVWVPTLSSILHLKEDDKGYHIVSYRGGLDAHIVLYSLFKGR